MIEEWRTVVWNDLYDVSSWGRVRSWNNSGNNRSGRRESPRILKPRANSGGYMYVQFGKESGNTSVHRLVLEAFVGPCPDGMEACHYPDSNTANNRSDNLKWDTRPANHEHKNEHGTMMRGESHARAKLTDTQVKQALDMYAEIDFNGKKIYSQQQVADHFGVAQTCISLYVRGKKRKEVTCV